MDLLFDWFGLVCFTNKNNFVSCHTADSKPVKQEVKSAVIFTLLVFLDQINLVMQKARVFVTVIHFQLSLIISGRARAYLSEAPTGPPKILD
jgi:hypothetical protein